jgi:hypothetical protein
MSVYEISDQTEVITIRWNDNGVVRFVPLDENNTDYQAYLAWLAEGNQPEVVEL